MSATVVFFPMEELQKEQRVQAFMCGENGRMAIRRAEPRNHAGLFKGQSAEKRDLRRDLEKR